MVSYSADRDASATTPFPAIVGQAELKRALQAVAVNDALDGLLVRGEKGTAKSTAVRGLVECLPAQRAVADCPYGCPPDEPGRQCADCRSRDVGDLPVEQRTVPLVTLPLGATRERVVGTLSISDALDGETGFDPGLLARANRGFLYVDEVNLLDDHLVDVLLDAAASGRNRVERDGVSVAHPADFTLVGTMNPEEGELRPQLRDRFALQATVVGCRDVADRVEIVDRALDRDADPTAFARAYEDETAAVEARIREARQRLPEVDLPAEWTRDIAELCLDADVDGHRGDIAIARTARTLAALDGRRRVIEPDLKAGARLALPHRLQSRPFDDAPDLEDVLDEHFDDRGGDGDRRDGGEQPERDAEEDRSERDDGEGTSDGGGDDRSDRDGGDGSADEDGTERGGREAKSGGGRRGGESGSDPADETADRSAGSDREPSADRDDRHDEGTASGDDDTAPATPLVPGQRRAGIGEADRPPVEAVDADSDVSGGGVSARTNPSVTGRGARVRTKHPSDGESVDAAASIRAAATEGRTALDVDDLRTTVRRASAGTLLVFVVDASASMRAAMEAAKGTVMSLLRDAYERRDEVAFVAVAGESADVVLAPTDSVTLAARHLKELPTGDRTPLPSGLDAAVRLVERADAPASRVVVVSDGRANVADGSPTAATREASSRLARTEADVLVVDASDGRDRTGLLDVLADETDARRIPLSALSVERVVDPPPGRRERDDGAGPS
ncbi:VWA domain-containing protein [Halovivax limisalsi]|uniref:VWA domain-containing protein n=1 Tax=Halovivax limisalsi TaxID=1453760 RepID=UPI001FFC4704|nr:VWA domain-containing protein [Halovivax limisalsi]